MCKLHLGCGNRKIHGFVNVDIREEVNPEVVDDIFELKSFQNDSADLIYVCHALEHADKEKSLSALRRWYELLRSNGVLRISVPDMAAVFEHYVYHRNLKKLHAFLWGSQRHKHDYHYHGWDESTLTESLLGVGFMKVRRYDWRLTDHCHVDDYSQAYLPHMDKTNGRLMSLNVEAVK